MATNFLHIEIKNKEMAKNADGHVVAYIDMYKRIIHTSMRAVFEILTS